ncbi:MAG TPA: metallopeptidase TldD-related protein, partial [Methanomassiliicoccales archaeon]|nr:metallopeptidase TldD-related protein [Methanomassiliicoccales archaeon]
TKAVAAQKAEHFKGGGKMTVIIPPHELSELLMSTVGFAVSAENINRQRSAWAKSMGERVASPKITIVDDPFDDRGMNSCAYDDEGAMTNRKVILDRGVLKTSLNDQYNALLSGTKPTGNALRRSPMDSQNLYRFPIDITPVNLVLEPGEVSVDQAIAGIEHGIMVDKLASSEANPITGAFGLEVRCAYLIEKGIVKGTIDHALLAGNMYEALKNVRQVCDDATVFRSTIIPSVAFDGLEVIGN